MRPVYCKDSASECNESLLSNCRVQPILCKDSASECNESLLSHCRVQPILCKDSDYKPNLQTYSHKKVFYSQFRCFFKHNNAGFQTRLLLIANKPCFNCKQGLFEKVKEQKMQRAKNILKYKQLRPIYKIIHKAMQTPNAMLQETICKAHHKSLTANIGGRASRSTTPSKHSINHNS